MVELVEWKILTKLRRCGIGGVPRTLAGILSGQLQILFIARRDVRRVVPVFDEICHLELAGDNTCRILRQGTFRYVDPGQASRTVRQSTQRGDTLKYQTHQLSLAGSAGFREDGLELGSSCVLRNVLGN
jgi:hypothetical protein